MTRLARSLTAETSSPVRLGLRANLGQFSLLIGISGLVGAMVGHERAVLPLLARDVFGIPAVGAALAFVGAFGLTKAATNLVAGAAVDRFGRKPVLVLGWLFALPVPLLIIAAPDWSWIVVANVLLGINQGLTWSTTVIMKIDLVGPSRRGFAMGLNEAAGYGAVAAAALLTAWIASEAGLRPAPFLFGLACAGLGLGASLLFVRDTTSYARSEQAAGGDANRHRWREVFLITTIRDRSLSAASQAGLVNNLNDGMAWALLPLFFVAAGVPLVEVGILVAVYPAVWGLTQVATGALSDRIGRKPLIVAGMLVQALAIGAIALASSFPAWLVASAILGLGTAMVYPTLLAVVADVAAPTWRGAALGVYRFWRDLGFAVGALAIGLTAAAFGMPAAIVGVALLTAASGVLVAVRMQEAR